MLFEATECALCEAFDICDIVDMSSSLPPPLRCIFSRERVDFAVLVTVAASASLARVPRNYTIVLRGVVWRGRRLFFHPERAPTARTLHATRPHREHTPPHTAPHRSAFIVSPQL